MNKLYKTAYMFFIWAAFTLCGCAGKESAQIYLEAKTQDSRKIQETDSESATECETIPAADSSKQQETCFVYVCGAVKHPGVFELPEGSRVYEAIALAGGLCKNAYEKNINQAKQIEDGEMIEVLTAEEYKELGQSPQGAKEPDKELEKEQQDGRININTASMEELMTLSGIGEAKAANIIDYRESNGGFSAPEDLMDVNGIGEGVYAKIQDKIKVIQ